MASHGKTDMRRVQRDLRAIREAGETKAASDRAEPVRTQPTPTVLASRGNVVPARSNITLLRYWADRSEWVRAAIDHRRNQVGHTAWDIVPIEPGEPFDEAR